MKRSIILFCTLLLLIVSAVPALASKVLADIEYFYADDGTLIGKAFNGKRVNFEYDLRGQLLAVKDAQGKDLERYTYDPAGNRLSKTINGVTTAYTYDKANQLVTSTVNGKTTHYKYDAAGRMIQAGDKKYIYNGQNKVAEVRQNGKTIAKFEYNIDGQIAKAIYGDKVEEFMWDGLALIWRSGVTYINEPYVTGGNPVMAGNDVLFNDMLGNTLAVNGNPVEMTSFGETADKNAFFTGKPMIDELGYTFLFRNYRSDYGKWQTTDPLGYPDGWNNLAYCGNNSTFVIDPDGCKWEFGVCQRGADGSSFPHAWIEGRNTKTGERVTYSGYTPENNYSGSSGSGGGSSNTSGSGSSGSGSSSPSLSGVPGYLNLYKNAGPDFYTSTSVWGTSNYVAIPVADAAAGEHIKAILDAAYSQYNQDSISYGATTLLPGDYNSNSLASTLLQKIGLSDRQIEAIDEKLPGTLVGWGKYLPKSAFKE